MNVGEYGISFNLMVSYDISGYSGLSLAFTRPGGSTFTATNPAVSVGASPLTTPAGTFAANQYCVYIFKAGDLTEAGTYSVRLQYDDGTKHLVSDATTFTVNP